MNKSIFNKIIEEKKINYAGMTKVTGLLLCNLSHKAIFPLMKYNAAKFNTEFSFIEYEYSDFFTFYNLFKDEIIEKKPNNIFILYDENYYLDKYKTCRPLEQVITEIEKREKEIAFIVNNLEENSETNLDIIISTLYLNDNKLKQYISIEEREAIKNKVNDFNINLYNLKRTIFSKINLCIVDMNGFYGESLEDIYSEGNSVATLSFLNYFAKNAIDYIRLKQGKSLKCIITDLDNTLWDGVMAEQSTLIKTKNDIYFKRYQKWLKRMQQQGVILSIVSKNDSDFIKCFFTKYQDELAISWDDFTFPEINWENKSSNILHICQRLNISTEHILYIDDNLYEIQEVKNSIEKINIFHFGNDIKENVDTLLVSDYFLKEKITQEDILRNDTFIADIKREKLSNELKNHDDFLKDIKMVLHVRELNTKDIERISDLTLRTNQFNMTTTRMKKSDVINYAKDNHILVYDFEDRLGNYGIIGASFIKKENDAFIIDNMVLSCRVFGRGVEYAMIKSILELSNKVDIKYLTGKFIETSKNKNFSSFYTDCGLKWQKDNIYKSSINNIDINKKCRLIKIIGE